MPRLMIALAAAATLLAACGQAEPTPAAEPVIADVLAPEMPADAPPQEELQSVPAVAAPASDPSSCLAEIGAASSARLVERCIKLSPATRPPCNAANSCALIQGEIDRSCDMYPPDQAKPAECSA